MADEKLNTGPAENISPEAAEPITTPEQAAASEPQQEQTGPAIPEPGDVVVSFDKINELMAEKRQNARAEVEKAETPEAPEAAASGEILQPANTEEPKKPRRGRPPKAEKAATENQKSEKSAGARKGRPPKADKTAPDKPKPSKRDNTYESTHDYDEYHFDLDEIEHDPYVLLSLLCALHEGQWTIDEVQGTLQMLFDRQYILTEDVVVETRYRTETDTWTDEDGNSHTDTYQVPYDYYICTVTLENFDLSHVPVYVMGENQLSRYAIYMATLGNRPDLFPDSPYVNKYITGKPGDYEVPGEYLDDETFAAMLAEAQKYIGYPYVWGGSSPATSFDCSGYVSWVINHSGWNVGRLGAQGLYNICTPTSSPKPGDLVFFKGTYDTPGVSHCGIYVGDGKMLHCGDPIGYANLNTSYWQSHFYAYGRLP